MSSIRLINYVIIGEQPDGAPVVLRLSTSVKGRDIYSDEFETNARDEFKHRYPEARIVKGGAGWSQPYDMQLEEE